MDKMRGMVAIVTGSSRGLGRAIALEYGREGATVVACAERTVEHVRGRAQAVVLCLIGRTAVHELGNPSCRWAHRAPRRSG